MYYTESLLYNLVRIVIPQTSVQKANTIANVFEKFPSLTKKAYLSAVIQKNMVTEELKRLYYEYTGSQAEDIIELPSSCSSMILHEKSSLLYNILDY